MAIDIETFLRHRVYIINDILKKGDQSLIECEIFYAKRALFIQIFYIT